MSNRKLTWILAGAFFLLYVFLLWFRPMESWCDDAYWTDWARQLGLHNRYYTTVWGFGKPSYSPLYALLLGGWFKIVGFSYFKAQFPNIVITLVNYLLLSWGIRREKLIQSRLGFSLFSILFWLSPVTFGIYNCGRMENLCLLLGLCSFYCFIGMCRRPSWRVGLGLFVSSAMLFATGVEGVVFATLLCLIFSCVLWRDSIDQWKSRILCPYALHFGGYVGGLAGCCIITYNAGCLHAFFDTMFGFSKTFTNTYLYIRALVKNTKHGEVVDTFQRPIDNHYSFWENLWNGLCNNTEYCVLALILIGVVVTALCLKKRNKVSSLQIVLITMALISPFVYVLAGRYTSYYTWAAFVPLVIALVSCLEIVDWHRVVSMSVGLYIITIFAMDPKSLSSIDIHRDKDHRNRNEIAQVSKYIQPGVPCVIPYQWYYYIVDSDEDIYFQASGAYPDILKYVIYSPSDYNEEQFMKSRNMVAIDRIGEKTVYEIISTCN